MKPSPHSHRSVEKRVKYFYRIIKVIHTTIRSNRNKNKSIYSNYSIKIHPHRNAKVGSLDHSLSKVRRNIVPDDAN